MKYQTLVDFEAKNCGELVFKISAFGIELSRSGSSKKFKGEDGVVEGFWEGVRQAGEGGVYDVKPRNENKVVLMKVENKETEGKRRRRR